jgi:DHA3 family tetracycline resistance protein-like MFS transporter
VAQVEQLARLAAVPLSFGLAAISLQLSILLGGAIMLPLAAFLATTMTERGFAPTTEAGRSVWLAFGATFRDGWRLIRGSMVLMTIFCIVVIYGMSGVGFDRLWVAQFYDNLGFPTTGGLEPIAWLAVLRIGAPLMGIATVEIVRRRLDTASHASVSRGLMIIYLLQFVSLTAFGFAQGFVMGMISFWAVISLFRAYRPVFLAWINQNVDSSVRATVMSMTSQVDAIGQVAAGPVVGALGLWVGLRTALLASAGMMATALPFFVRAIGQGASRSEASRKT